VYLTACTSRGGEEEEEEEERSQIEIRIKIDHTARLHIEDQIGNQITASKIESIKLN
jgi:hypothetical protein